ncbi:MAG TPA: DUF3237 domain-containing protein [Rhizomicrobium sp.]|nr:DUF3237 domain-containing protein [Rhizomicrobium sp.]
MAEASKSAPSPDQVPRLPVSLEFLARFEIEAASMNPVGAVPAGTRRCDLIDDGRFEGPNLKGRVISGMDALLDVGNDIIRPDVRLLLETHDGTKIYMHYTGIIHCRPDVLARLRRREDINADEFYLRTSVQFECGDPKYAWLNTFIGIGTYGSVSFASGKKGSLYDIYRVL